MDEATVDLIIALQMHDLELLMSSWKGKSVEGSVMTDDQLTVDLQQAELQKQESMLADIRMARSISRAVQDDGITVAILMAEERRSAQDREMACRMSGKPYSDVSNVPDCSVDEDILSRFGRLNIRQAKDENENKDERDGQSCYGESVFSFNEVETGESSSWAAGQETGKSKGKGKFKNECVACNEVRDTVQVPCQHQYCKICVVQIVGDSIMDESLFPPRCCGHEMPMSLIRPYLPFELIVQFQQTAIEFGTPNRTYCFSCGTFVNPDNIHGHRAHCATCNLDTCMLCKVRFHGGDCPQDPALQAVLQLAQETGWQRCTSCQTMIERREGCNHIT